MLYCGIVIVQVYEVHCTVCNVLLSKLYCSLLVCSKECSPDITMMWDVQIGPYYTILSSNIASIFFYILILTELSLRTLDANIENQIMSCFLGSN